MRTARRRAHHLGLDYTHFTGQRRWSDGQLSRAVSAAETWTHVVDILGLSSASSESLTTLRGHALRLGLETAHLEPPAMPVPQGATPSPKLDHLARAGSLLAAAWYELCGIHVAWPLEPARYDFLAWTDGRAERIQVKTTRQRCRTGWRVRLATSRTVVHTYGPDEIDQFFIIDGELTHYLIPLAVVGGRKEIALARYSAYILPPPSAIRAPATACPPPRTPPPGSSSDR